MSLFFDYSQRLLTGLAVCLSLAACAEPRPDATDLQAKLEQAVRLHYARDREQAVALYGKLAELGCAKAQANYALLLEEMPYYEPSTHDKEILAWLHRAAEQGYAHAQYSLAMGHDMGFWGLSRRNFVEALPWYEKAANLGHPHAMFGLYSIHYHGHGIVTPDQAMAYKWLTLAAARFPPPTERPAHNLGTAHEGRARMLGIRARLAQFMTPEQIAEGERRAQTWEDANNYVRRMPEQSDEPLPLWFDAIEAGCNG